MNHWNKLSPIQRQAAQHPNGPLLIAAGAGSGKTLTLTSRLFHLLELGVDPKKIIAITFTNKAAKEMAHRVHTFAATAKINFSELPFIGTFHSLGARILKDEGHIFHRTKGFTIFDEEDSASLIKQIVKIMDLPKDRYSPAMLIGKVSEIKNELLDIEAFERANKNNQVAAAVFRAYEAMLERNNAFDFDDLITKVVLVLEQRPDVLARYQQLWQHILVDEFQDVNTSQYRMISLLAREHQNLFVIGDDAQSIYSFRGSDFRNFLNFAKDWEQAKIIKLEENYRSTKNIIRAASELIKKNTLQTPKDLWTNNPDGSLIHVTAFRSGEEEAWGIGEKILELIRKGESLKDIAILYRTNAQSRAMEQSCIQQGIAYEIFGGLKFYARKEIKDIVAGLRFALNPNDSVSKERILKTFNKKEGGAILQDLPRLGTELPIHELIQYFIENTRYVEYLERHFKNIQERLENIKELIHFASSFKNGHDFLEQVALLSSGDGRPKLQENAVKLMTMHMAKGLEFKHVFLIGVNEHLIPHERSLMNNDDLEEERRLMYVGMTRAKENLHLSFYDLPSRFLGELPPELIEFKTVSPYREENRDWDEDTIYLE